MCKCFPHRPYEVQLINRATSLYAVLISPAGPTTPVASTFLTTRASNTRSKGLQSIVGPIVGAGLSRHTKTHHPLISGIVRSSILSSPTEGYARSTDALARATAPPVYEAIRGEILIVVGREDKMMKREDGADIIQRGVKGAKCRIEVLENVAHWAQLEAVDATAKLLKEFLDESGIVSARL